MICLSLDLYCLVLMRLNIILCKYFLLKIWILGIKVIRRKNEYILTQSHYIEKVLTRFNYFDFKPKKTPIDPHSSLIRNIGDYIN